MGTKTKKNCANCENLEINNCGGAECFYHKNDECNPRSLRRHKSKKITNLEWLRSLSDEEFIKFMIDFSIKRCVCCGFRNTTDCLGEICIDGIPVWFNQLREED